MSTRTRRIVQVSTVAAWVVVIAGVGVLATSFLFQAAGAPWDAVNDWFLLFMIGALAPLMLSFYELGGRTPLRLAQLAQEDDRPRVGGASASVLTPHEGEQRRQDGWTTPEQLLHRASWHARDAPCQAIEERVGGEVGQFRVA